MDARMEGFSHASLVEPLGGFQIGGILVPLEVVGGEVPSNQDPKSRSASIKRSSVQCMPKSSLMPSMQIRLSKIKDHIVDVLVTSKCIHLYILYCTLMFLSRESFVFHYTPMFLLGESLI